MLEDIDMPRAGDGDAGQRHHHQAPHVGVEPRHMRHQPVAREPDRRRDDDEVDDAREDNRPDQDEPGLPRSAQAGRERIEQRRDQQQVEQHRSPRCDGVAAEGVERAGEDRDNQDHRHEGEDDAPVGDRVVEFLWRRRKARGDHADDRRHQELRRKQDQEAEAEENGERRLREGLRRLRSLIRLPAGEDRDIGRIERPFADESAEEIGDQEGRDIGVGDGRRAQHGGDQHVPHESGDPRDERG
jgi:hypothetical protein